MSPLASLQGWLQGDHGRTARWAWLGNRISDVRFWLWRNKAFTYWRLYRDVRQVYTRHGAWLWLRHHHRKGTPLAEQLRLIESLRTGAYE